MKIALFTDQGAHYREPVFSQISEDTPPDFEIDFYIPSNKKRDFNILGTDTKIKNVYRFENRYVTKLSYIQWPAIKVALGSKYDFLVLWGGTNVISNYFAVLFSKLTGKKLFLWGHGAYGNEGFLKRLLRKYLFVFADHQFTYGDRAVKIINNWLPNKKLVPIYNSLDFVKLNEIYLKAPDHELRWDFIFVGRLTKVKNLELLFQALQMGNNNGQAFSLLIVGSGADEDHLKALTKELDVDKNITWAGACYDEEKLVEYFKKSRFCVSPGNIGLMAMHSLYFRTPVITHNCLAQQMPEAEVIKDDYNGFLFEYNDLEDLYKTMSDSIKVDTKKMNENCFDSIKDDYTPLAQSTTFWRTIDLYN